MVHNQESVCIGSGGANTLSLHERTWVYWLKLPNQTTIHAGLRWRIGRILSRLTASGGFWHSEDIYASTATNQLRLQKFVADDRILELTGHGLNNATLFRNNRKAFFQSNSLFVSYAAVRSYGIAYNLY